MGTLLAGCVSGPILSEDDPAEAQLYNQRTDHVEATVVIEVLPDRRNDLDQNTTVINRTVDIEPDGAVTLQEEPFQYGGDYAITVSTNLNSTESRVIQNYDPTLDSFIEIGVTSDEIRIVEVVS